MGIDVAKRKLDVALLDERGKVKSRVFSNDVAGHTAMRSWLRERGATHEGTHVCLESTGPYSDAPALALVDDGWRVSLVNPALPKRFAESQLLRNKTDSTDAKLLAHYCEKMQPELWQPPSKAQRKLRARVDRLQSLKDMRQQEMNRLEGTPDEQTCKSIGEHVSWLDARIAELEKQVTAQIDAKDDSGTGGDQSGDEQLKADAKLLTSIPGLGKTTAAKVLAYLGDLRRFSSAKALAAFIGVTPKRAESGSSVHGQSKISRMGNAYVRQALYMPAVVACKHNPFIKALRARMDAAGRKKKVAVLAAMHKLVHLMFGVIRSGLPFDPQHRSQPASA